MPSPAVSPLTVLPTAALLAAAGLLPASAAAGVYIEGAIGFPSTSAETLFEGDDSGQPDFEADFDTSNVFYGAVGIDGGLFRSELELSFRDSDIENFRTSGGGPAAGSGSFDSVALMSNLYLDLPLPATGFSVWAGGGVGVVQFEGNIDSVGSLDDSDFEDAEYGFAYQLRAGVTYDLTRNLSVNAGYRYWHAGEVDFENVRLDETELHTIDIGLRLTF